MERRLDGSTFQATNQLTGNCPVRKKIYSTMAKGIAELAEEAFLLARSKDNFAIWNLTASKYADWVVRLGMMKTTWIWEDRLVKGEIPSAGFVMDCVQRGQLDIQDKVSLETFLRAHSLHHPPASHTSIPSTTLSVSSPDAKPISNATQLAPTLPAHHPHPSQTKAGPQKLPPHHPQAVSTTSLKAKKVPNHHQGRAQVTKSPIPVVSTTPIPPPPPPPPISSTTPTISKSSSSPNWRGPRTPLSSDPPPSNPCSKCGSWSKYHPSSLCKRQRRYAQKKMKEQAQKGPMFTLEEVVRTLQLLELVNSFPLFPHQPLFSFGGGGKWDPGTNFGRAHGRVPR